MPEHGVALVDGRGGQRTHSPSHILVGVELDVVGGRQRHGGNLARVLVKVVSSFVGPAPHARSGRGRARGQRRTRRTTKAEHCDETEAIGVFSFSESAFVLDLKTLPTGPEEIKQLK